MDATNKILVVDLMTHNCDLVTESSEWRRSKPMCRVKIMERKVYLNDRLVTHTEVSVPRGESYKIKVWNTHHDGFEMFKVTV